MRYREKRASVEHRFACVARLHEPQLRVRRETHDTAIPELDSRHFGRAGRIAAAAVGSRRRIQLLRLEATRDETESEREDERGTHERSDE